MKNAVWAEFVGIRDQARYAFAELVADFLAGEGGMVLLGEIGGAVRILNTLPYGRGTEDELRRSLATAHRINKECGRKCGCRTRQRCNLEGRSPSILRELLLGPDREDRSELFYADDPLYFPT